MFFSYVVRDVVEIEPVYFPSTLKGSVVPSAVTPTTPTKTVTTVTSSADPSEAPTGLTTSPLPAVSAATVGRAYALSLEEIVQHRITEMYVGKVLPGKGLCVALVGVLAYSDSEIKGPSGAAWLTATFSLCVFSPRPGARLRASIVDQDASGLYLTIDFFSAFPFFVPASELIPGSVFDTVARKWCMPVEVDASAAPGTPSVNYYELDEEVMVKVLQCVARLESEVRVCNEEGQPVPLMELVGSFAGDGLGPVAWFEGEEEVEADDNGPAGTA